MALTLSLPDRFNVAEHFFLPRLEAGDEAAPYLLCGDETLSVGAAHAAADRVAFALKRLGLRTGERVALLLRESLDYSACFWGSVRAGLVPVPLNTVLTAADYHYYLGDSRARALIVDGALWPLAAQALEGVAALRHVVVSGEPEPGAVPHPKLADLLADLPDPLPGRFPVRMAGPGDPAFWLYTSGSTGRPKAAVHRHQDMVYVAETYLRHGLPLAPGERTYSAPKMFFAYGLGNSLYFPLASATTAVIAPGPATPRDAFALLEHHRPTVFYAVPTLFNGMLRLYDAWREGREHPPAPLPTLASLRVAVSGGEPLPSAVLERWRTHFRVDILDGIGSTEALHFYVANRPGHVRPGSTGLPVPGYDLRIVDMAGNDAPDDVAGELWVRGGSVTRGYWNDRARTRRSLQGGWLRTGDRFRRDAGGYYYYEGREDDLLKIGGSWVNPADVEHVLLTHPDVAECAVVGRANGDGLVESVACVVLRGGTVPGPALADGLRAHASAKLAAFKVPRHVEFLAALPHTATGKVRRFLLRRSPEVERTA